MSEDVRGSVNIMGTAPVGQVAEIAAHAETLGYSRIWLYDEGISTRDVFVGLTAVARATTAAMIGPGVTNAYARHPGQTAAAMASLAELSAGRAFLGLGAGGGLTLGPLALDRRRPLTAVEEAVHALRRLWNTETVDLRGRTLELHDARLACGTGHSIEVHLAGRGPRMVDLAARIADGFYLSYVHKDAIAGIVERLRSHRRPLTLTYSTRFVTDDTGWDAARRDMSFRLPDSPADIHDLIGMTDSDVAMLRAALRAGGPDKAASLVRDEWVTPFVIAGTPSECKAELAELVGTHGIDEVLVALHDLQEAPDHLAAMAAIIDF